MAGRERPSARRLCAWPLRGSRCGPDRRVPSRPSRCRVRSVAAASPTRGWSKSLRDGVRAPVFLHSPWYGAEGYGSTTVYPASECLDAFMLAREGGPFPVGFDIAGSPLAGLPIEDAVYMHGYDPFTLETFCDGWIYLKPMGECEPVAFSEGWIHEGNVEHARAASMNPRWRTSDVEQFDVGCRSYLDDAERFFGHLR